METVLILKLDFAALNSQTLIMRERLTLWTVLVMMKIITGLNG